MGSLAADRCNEILPGQYFDAETGLHQNWFRDYDPATDRYLQFDPIGLRGGLNGYVYARANPLRYTDPYGLTPWDWDGLGDTSPCRYYDEMAAKYPKCGYYEGAAQVCRGQFGSTNRWTNGGIAYAWARNGLQDSQSVILTKIRNGLINADKANRDAGNACEDGCPKGDDIDAYHERVFEGLGLSPYAYGGSVYPQGLWPSPVPYDPRGHDPLDDVVNNPPQFPIP